MNKIIDPIIDPVYMSKNVDTYINILKISTYIIDMINVTHNNKSIMYTNLQ